MMSPWTLHLWIALVAVSASVLPGTTQQAMAQDVNEFQVKIKFEHGRFVTSCDTAQLTLSAEYRKLLRKDLTDAQLKSNFCDALVRQFRLMPKPYFFMLTDDECALDLAGNLDTPEMKALREWTGPVDSTVPRIGKLAESRAESRCSVEGFDAQLARVTDRSGLAEWLNQEDRFDQPFRFRVRDPLSLDALDISPSKVLTKTRILALLKPLDQAPTNPGLIKDALLDFCTPRGLTPRIDVQADASPVAISISDTIKVARLLLPADLKDQTAALQIAYSVLPHRAFSAFRNRVDELLKPDLGSEVAKREIDLQTLGTPAKPVEPFAIDTTNLADIQQRLLPLKFSSSVFEFNSANQWVDLVIDKTTPESGAATSANSVTASSETPPNAPTVSARPDSVTDITPAPVAASTGRPQRAGNTPRLEQKNFLGLGFEYKPEQGVRLLGSFQRKNSFGFDLTRVEAGGGTSGFGSAEYSKDFVLFNKLARRLKIDTGAGTEFESKRVVVGQLVDERRTGAGARGELELYRDGPDRQLNVFLEARRERVVLTAAATDATDATGDELVRALLTRIDLGASYSWRKTLTGHPASLRLEAAGRFGLPVDESSAFRRLHGRAQYHYSIAGPVELETRFEFRHATSATPSFELPTLGGLESVRGFRSDEESGHVLWSWQNEIWVPVMKGGAPSKFRDFMRRNIRAAGIFDSGRRIDVLTDQTASQALLRLGAGVGLRVKYQGVIIELDWVKALGAAENRPPNGRFYFNFRLP